MVVGLAAVDYLREAIAAEEMGPLPADAMAGIQQIYAEGIS